MIRSSRALHPSSVSSSCLAFAFAAGALALACSGTDMTSEKDAGVATPGTGAATGGGGTTGGGTTGAPTPGTGGDGGASSTAGDGGSGTTGGATTADGGGAIAGDMTAIQKTKAQMLTSIWENSTTVLQYPYCENIGDNRGYTAGRAGFCSGTGDMIQVVECFDATLTGAGNKLAKYMPALKAIDAKFQSTGNDQGDTSPLDAVGPYCADWTSSAKDAASASAFKGCQDAIVDTLYYRPAIAEAAKWGLVTALTKAELYDAAINHGEDGMQDLVKKANTDSGNTAQTPASAPLAQDKESLWLKAFLARRLKLLKGDATWKESVDRVTTYEQLRLEGNFDLSAEIRTNAKAVTMYPGQGYIDSGYPDCKISPTATVSGDAVCTSPTGL